jgi:hypothetical protein
MVIEGRGRSQDQVDVRQIARAQHTDRTVRSMEYHHMKPDEEPPLWIVDVAAWAYGAVGDCRRRQRHQIGLERAKPRLTSSEDGPGFTSAGSCPWQRPVSAHKTFMSPTPAT